MIHTSHVTMYDVLVDALANHNVDKIERPKNVPGPATPLVPYVVTDIGWFAVGKAPQGSRRMEVVRVLLGRRQRPFI